MKTKIAAGLIGAALILGTAVPSFSGQSGSSTEKNLTKDQAIAKATKAKHGNVLKATLEKRDNQVIWEVKVEDGGRNTTTVQVDPRSGEIIKTIDNADGK